MVREAENRSIGSVCLGRYFIRRKCKQEETSSSLTLTIINGPLKAFTQLSTDTQVKLWLLEIFLNDMTVQAF